MIVPGWPFAIAAMRMNGIDPKFASGRALQRVSSESQVEGASAIHSAEVKSWGRSGSSFVKFVFRVRSFTCRSTPVGTTFTDAEIRSPGRIFNFTVTEAAGTSSYQAV